MGRRSADAYDRALGLRESEAATADTFEAEFPIVTDRRVRLIESMGDPPDRIALMDGIETGVELTAIHAGSAEDIICEILRLAQQKHSSYVRRHLFDAGPIILLGHLDWPSREVEGPALYDMRQDLAKLTTPHNFDSFGFSEIWLMDAGTKYTSRRDPRAPADFFCFAPTESAGFWRRERKRRPYWSLTQDLLT
jgi:hypothetical protein